MPMSEVYQKALTITHLRCGSRTNLHRSAPEEKWGLDSFSSSQFKRWFAKCPVFFSQTPLREVFQLDAICSLNMLNSIRKTNGKVQVHFPMGLSQKCTTKPMNKKASVRGTSYPQFLGMPYGIRQGKFRLVVAYGCDRSVSQNSLQGVDEICPIHLEVLRYSPCNLAW